MPHYDQTATYNEILISLTVPNPPQNVLVTNVTDTMAIVQWSSPAEDNIPIDRYILNVDPQIEGFPESKY